MLADPPHVLLRCESRTADRDDPNSPGHWRFVLQSAASSHRMEVHELEPEVRGDRLALLAVVRGLEALEQPSRVTLVTSSQYVRQGLSKGLEQWKSDAWRWQWYGEMVPIKHADLWQRVDQALQFHTVVCRVWLIEAADSPLRPRLAQPTGPMHNRLEQAAVRTRWLPQAAAAF